MSFVTSASDALLKQPANGLSCYRAPVDRAKWPLNYIIVEPEACGFSPSNYPVALSAQVKAILIAWPWQRTALVRRQLSAFGAFPTVPIYSHSIVLFKMRTTHLTAYLLLLYTSLSMQSQADGLATGKCDNADWKGLG